VVLPEATQNIDHNVATKVCIEEGINAFNLPILNIFSDHDGIGEATSNKANTRNQDEGAYHSSSVDQDMIKVVKH
jgi:hypothetical protein